MKNEKHTMYSAASIARVRVGPWRMAGELVARIWLCAVLAVPVVQVFLFFAQLISLTAAQVIAPAANVLAVLMMKFTTDSFMGALPEDWGW